MENFRAIEYHQTRDFSKKISATFEFIRQNFKSLGKAILVIAGPPVLVASMMLGSFFNDFFSASFNANGNPDIFANLFLQPSFWLEIAMMFVFIILSTVLTIATINNYILLYEQKKSNKLEVKEVWDKVRETFWMYLGTGVLLTILVVIAYVGLIAVIGVLSATGSVLLIFVGVVVTGSAFFYLVVCMSLVFIVRSYERVGFFQSVERSFVLIRGKWWSTFGLVMVLYLIVTTASYIFLIPWYAMTIVSAMHTVQTGSVETQSVGYQILTMSFFTLYYLSQMILYALPNVGVAFQYFNLVERKEARGLMSKIESFGEQTTAPTQTHDEHY